MRTALIHLLGRPLALGVALGVLLGVVLGGASPADAQRARRGRQEPTPVAQARALFAEGVSHVEARRFAEAESAFRGALALRDAPTIRYNLASVLFEQREYPEAAAQLESVLADASAPQEVRAHATDLRRQLQSQAGFARVEWAGAADATIAVDGFRLSDPTLEVALSPGPHTAVASREERELARESLVLQVGEHAVFRLGVARPLDAARTVDTSASLAETDVTTRDDDDALVEQWWFWTAVGGGVVLSAVLIGVAASSGGVEEPIPGNFQPGVLRW